jgi:hypothetical protein
MDRTVAHLNIEHYRKLLTQEDAHYQLPALHVSVKCSRCTTNSSSNGGYELVRMPDGTNDCVRALTNPY